MYRRKLIFYYPGKGHATLSVTGTGCALRCKHCSGKYLESMIDVATPEKFREVIRELRITGKKGILLSGGCDSGGCVPFGHLRNEIAKAVSEDYFRINVHTGRIDLPGALELKGLGIENVCIDMVGTAEALLEVYGIEAVPGESLKALAAAGFAEIIPHITVGLVGGKLSHEFEALRLVREHLGEPKKLVLLSLIPTKGTDYEDADPVDSRDMLKVIRNARNMFPTSELILGCMRPHYSAREITRMIEVGIDGLVNPPDKVEKNLARIGDESNKGGNRSIIERKTSCCSF